MFRNLLLIVAIFGLGWGASFGAGTAYGRRTTATTAAAQAATIPLGQGQAAAGGAQGGQAGPGGAGGTGGGGFAGGAGGRAGVVERVEGQTLTLRAANNQPVRVTLTDQTQVLKTVEGTAGDLTAGATVTVQPQGQPGADGAISASAITVLPANAGARQGGAGGAGGAAGQRQAGQGQGAPRAGG